MDVLPPYQSYGDAAAIPLHTGHRFQRLAVFERVVIAADQAPGRVDWIQEGEVGLLKQVTTVTVGKIDDAVVFQQIAGTEGSQVVTAVFRVPLIRATDLPAITG